MTANRADTAPGTSSSSAAPSAPVAPADAEISATSSSAPTAPSNRDLGSVPALPSGTVVLHIGDSFAEALGGELGKRFKSAGLRNVLESKTPSYIPNWSFSGDIPQFLAKYHPDLVLITLGANELEIPKPEQRVHAIKHLVTALGGRPCVWIAPPLWKPDSGVLRVIRDNVAPCRYLDSNALVHDLPRAQDKIHPSLEGRKVWADVVFQWLSRERAGSAEQPWALKPEAVGGGN